MDYTIRTSELSRSFGSFRAVKAIDLQVEKGTFYGCLGPNGAGKSTTIKMLTGLLAPSSGKIEVLVCNPRYSKEALQMKFNVGVVPENFSLFVNL